MHQNVALSSAKMRGWCVTNASPSGLRSCMEDEGRPFEVGFREQASNHPKRHRSKAVVVSVGEKAGDTGQVWITETSVSEPLMTCRKVPWRRRNQERVSLLGQGWEVPDDGPTGVRHEGGVTVILASIRNVRTCRSDVKGAGQAGGPCKTLSTEAEHRGGVARSSEEGSVMGLERRGGLVQWESDGQPVIGRNCRDLTTGSMVCPGREEPYETRVSRTVL